MTAAAAVVTDDTDVIAAITRRRLAEWSVDHDTPLARTAVQTCAAIGEQVAAESAEIVTWLRDHGLHLVVDISPVPRQRHELTVDVGSVEEADAVADTLAELGFEPWDRWSRGAERSFRHHAEQLTVARAGDHSFVLRLRWRRPEHTGRVRSLLRSVFRPTRGDWTMLALPTRVWPLYSVVRPARLVLERIGRRDPFAAGLGPFLSTPRSLIEPLLDLAELGPEDTLLDVGCGDGRLVINSADATGCRAIGVEVDHDLADRARRNATDAGVDDRVDIVCGDARDIDMAGVTATFMFLPMDALGNLVAPTLDRLPSGGRLIVHEQTPLADSLRPRPDSSHAVIAADAVTVAHVWHRV